MPDILSRRMSGIFIPMGLALGAFDTEYHSQCSGHRENEIEKYPYI